MKARKCEYELGFPLIIGELSLLYRIVLEPTEEGVLAEGRCCSGGANPSQCE